MRIGIIGAGLAGLAAGYQLSHDNDVIIFEKDDYPGGLLSSYQTGSYTIERYYHHFFSGDRILLDLIGELGLSDSVVWLSGSTGSYCNGVIHPLTSPLEILRYPCLHFLDKVRLGLFVLQSPRIDPAGLDGITAKEYITSRLGIRIYSSFFEPLLISKFGKNASLVSAAWLISRVSIRSDRGVAGERLGYLNRGFATLIEALVTRFRERGGSLRCNTPVTSVSYHPESTEDRWIVHGEPFDLLIGTASPKVLRDLGLPGIPDIPYQGAACMTLALPRDVADGIYWLNINDPAPFGAVVSHTNFAPLDWYGEHIVYLASYFTGEPEPDIGEKMLSDFCTKFSVKSDEVLWNRIAIDRQAGPLYLTGYKNNLARPEIPGLFLAGMFSAENYPERSMEGSIKAAWRVVEGIRSREQQ
jgi:protoporphyrinogen oxidase